MSPNITKHLPFVNKVLFELLIVFVGVFLAFRLNNYQKSIASQAIEQRYYQLILLEFQSNLQEIKNTKKAVSNYLDTLQKEIDKGEKPRLLSFQNYDLSNNMLVLKSAFESGYLENLNPKFVSNISIGSNYITRVGKRMDQFNAQVNLALQQNQWESNLFYTKEGLLKPKYDWYLNDLKFILGYLEGLETALEKGAIPDIQNIIATKAGA